MKKYFIPIKIYEDMENEEEIDVYHQFIDKTGGFGVMLNLNHIIAFQ